jgi:tetratricopeptide (TPR) repeat protein
MYSITKKEIVLLLLIAVVGVVAYFFNDSISTFLSDKKAIVSNAESADADHDGLNYVAETSIYKTDPQKSDSNGTGVSDGEYIYNIYKKAFETGNEESIAQYRKNVSDYNSSLAQSTSTTSLWCADLLNNLDTCLYLQKYDIYKDITPAVYTVLQRVSAYNLAGDYQKSVTLLQDESSKKPYSAILKYTLATTYDRVQNYRDALSIYKGILTDKTIKSPIIYANIAVAEYKLGNKDDFVHYMKLLTEEYPDFLSPYSVLAAHYRENKQFDEAENVLKEALKIKPCYASFYSELSALASIKNDSKNSLDLIKKAIACDFRFSPAHLSLSIFYDKNLSDYKNSLIEAQIAVELERNVRNLGRLVYAYNKSGLYEKANRLEAELLTMSDIDGKTYNDLGLVYLDRKQYKQAEVYFKKAIEVEPTLSNAYNDLGIIFYNTKRYDEAIINYKKAIELNPNYLNAYNNLGKVYDDTGRHAEAQINFEKNIALDPNNYHWYQNLGSHYATLNNEEKTIFYYRKAVELGSKEPIIINYLNEIDKKKDSDQKWIKNDSLSTTRVLYDKKGTVPVKQFWFFPFDIKQKSDLNLKVQVHVTSAIFVVDAENFAKLEKGERFDHLFLIDSGLSVFPLEVGKYMFVIMPFDKPVDYYLKLSVSQI